MGIEELKLIDGWDATPRIKLYMVKKVQREHRLDVVIKPLTSDHNEFFTFDECTTSRGDQDVKDYRMLRFKREGAKFYVWELLF